MRHDMRQSKIPPRIGSLLGIMLFTSSLANAASWSTWTVRPEAVFKGEHDIASDPTIIREESLYRMFYTCPVDLDLSVWTYLTGGTAFRLALCQATSRDGISWDLAPAIGDNVKGLALRGTQGQQDEYLEGSFILKKGSEYCLFHSTYGSRGNPQRGFPASLSVARSRDGQRFQSGWEPVLSPTLGGYDSDAIYSPTIIQDGDSYLMVYTGHCYNGCEREPNVVLLAATSPDGMSWEKLRTPVLQRSNRLPWMSEIVAEASLLKGPDGVYYLFFTGGQGERRSIGVARSSSITGPWDINPQPIISARPDTFYDCGALAPEVRLEGGTVRMWFHGFQCPERPLIGYAESQWPLYRE